MCDQAVLNCSCADAEAHTLVYSHTDKQMRAFLCECVRA